MHRMTLHKLVFNHHLFAKPKSASLRRYAELNSLDTSSLRPTPTASKRLSGKWKPLLIAKSPLIAAIC